MPFEDRSQASEACLLALSDASLLFRCKIVRALNSDEESETHLSARPHDARANLFGVWLSAAQLPAVCREVRDMVYFCSVRTVDRMCMYYVAHFLCLKRPARPSRPFSHDFLYADGMADLLRQSKRGPPSKSVVQSEPDRDDLSLADKTTTAAASPPTASPTASPIASPAGPPTTPLPKCVHDWFERAKEKDRCREGRRSRCLRKNCGNATNTCTRAQTRCLWSCCGVEDPDRKDPPCRCFCSAECLQRTRSSLPPEVVQVFGLASQPIPSSTGNKGCWVATSLRRSIACNVRLRGVLGARVGELDDEHARKLWDSATKVANVRLAALYRVSERLASRSELDALNDVSLTELLTEAFAHASRVYKSHLPRQVAVSTTIRPLPFVRACRWTEAGAVRNQGLVFQ